MGVQGAKPLEAPGISDFLVAEYGLKYQKIVQFTVLQKRPNIAFPVQCVISLYFITAWSKKFEKSVLRKLSAVLHKN